MNSLPPFSCRSRGSNGFTLLEMVITVAVFILLCTALFGIVSGVLESISGLQDNQNRSDQIERLNAFLYKKLKDLPAQSSVVSYLRGTGDGLDQNGIILGKDQNLIAIDATMGANGHYILRFAAFDPSTMPNLNIQPLTVFQTNLVQDQNISWTPLISDVASLDWKFKSPNAPDWAVYWNDSSTTPNLIEFSIQQAGDLQPSIMDFWLPHLAAAMQTTSGVASPRGGSNFPPGPNAP